MDKKRSTSGNSRCQWQQLELAPRPTRFKYKWPRAMESLRPVLSLLDSKFEGYKLSPNSLPHDSTRLVSGVNDIPLRDDLFSFQHLRAFGNFNHLVWDPWRFGDKQSVYFVDTNYAVQEATVKVAM